MKYYRAKGEFYDYTTGWTTVYGELLTEKERIKRFSNLRDSCFSVEEIKKTETYMFFGARFAYGDKPR